MCRRRPGRLPTRGPALKLALAFAAVSCISAGAAGLKLRGEFVDGSENSGVGLAGELDLFQRFTDSVGTVLQLIGRGLLDDGAIFHSERSGPLPFTYRNAYVKTKLPRCEGGIDSQCNVAASGLGTIGIVGYNFSSQDANLVGRAMQTQVTCLCVNVDCSLSVLVRPVRVTSGPDQNSLQCLLVHNDDRDRLVTCHTELLRIRSNQDSRSHPLPDQNPEAWNFSVITTSNWWVATGYRGKVQQEMTLAEFEQIPVHPRDLYGYNSAEVKDHFLQEIPQGETALSLRRGGVSALEGQSNPCNQPFIVAANGAAWIATQQDRHATGEEPASYVTEKPPLITDTELALVGSAAALGVLASFSILHRAESNLLDADVYSRNFEWHQATVTYSFTVLIAFAAFLLEALPLQVALSQEIDADRWVTEFLHLDVTMAVNGEKKINSGSLSLGEAGVASNGSVIVATPIIGKTEYLETRVVLVALLTFCFDFLFVLRFVWHTIKQVQLVKSVWRHRLEQAEIETLGDSDSELEESGGSLMRSKSAPAGVSANTVVQTPSTMLETSADGLRKLLTAVRKQPSTASAGAGELPLNSPRPPVAPRR